MKYALIITGLLAGLAMAAPMSVVFGYLFLIIPGLVLTAAPTVFVYLAATALIRRVLPITSVVASTVVAFGLALLLGWAVMQPFRTAALRDYHAQQAPDVSPDPLINLDGDVRVEIPDRRGDPECDYLCTVLLDSADVNSVTVAIGQDVQPARNRNTVQTNAYKLVDADPTDPVGLFPSNPGQLIHEYPPLIKTRTGRNIIVARKAIEADWALRLCGNERLHRVNPVEAESADWVIRVQEKRRYPTLDLREVTVADSNGTVRLRKRFHKQSVPAPMFYFGFHVSCGAGTISSASFHIGRQTLTTGPISLRPETELLSAIGLSLPRTDPQLLDTLREEVAQALDDPDAPQARLELSKRYLGLLFFNTVATDHALIARIVADDRVTDIDDSIRDVFSEKKFPVAMRDAYAKRIVMDHTSAELRHRLAKFLATLPPGTFAQPTLEHRKIWSTPELYCQAGPFMATLADLDPAVAMPTLNFALDHAVALDDYRQRRGLVDGIREALIRMGPDGVAAAPKIRELFLRRPSPIMRTSKEADQWRFALARMGVPDSDMPFFPGQSDQSITRIRSRVADRLKRYEDDQVGRSES
ncbi:hypothetical protein [Crateriforma conspicua]|uniref:Uncharacterized protein n=1 Tax=Crateriforma conspicua TaxID=2527996 RepID=A0A5C6G149_9PLAN|nr:hypothetical protein [Crateriforma conspicua]TWU67210.1 hypothetical protein V7x_27830 [Crateriforma conspicua]